MMQVWQARATQLVSGPRWPRRHHPRAATTAIVLLRIPLAVCAALVAVVSCASAPFDRPAATPSTTGAAGDAQRGEYLATVFACQDCHTGRGADGIHLDRSVLLAGGEPFPGPWGVARSANVSALVPALDDLTLEKLIRGQLAFLYPMPTEAYNTMAAQDMADLIRYLRTVPPSNRTAPASEMDAAFTPPPPNAPVPFPAAAPSGVTAARGKYLVTQGGCADCHTPRTAIGAPDPNRSLAGGGHQFPGPNGAVFEAPNLTPDPTTGLGSWTDAQIVAALREGRAPDGHQLHPAMPYASAYHAYTDEDATAIVRYLRELQPVSYALPANPAWAPGP